MAAKEKTLNDVFLEKTGRSLEGEGEPGGSPEEVRA